MGRAEPGGTSGAQAAGRPASRGLRMSPVLARSCPSHGEADAAHPLGAGTGTLQGSPGFLSVSRVVLRAAAAVHTTPPTLGAPLKVGCSLLTESPQVSFRCTRCRLKTRPCSLPERRRKETHHWCDGQVVGIYKLIFQEDLCALDTESLLILASR